LNGKIEQIVKNNQPESCGNFIYKRAFNIVGIAKMLDYQTNSQAFGG
jgi:hypothetical protein